MQCGVEAIANLDFREKFHNYFGILHDNLMVENGTGNGYWIEIVVVICVFDAKIYF